MLQKTLDNLADGYPSVIKISGDSLKSKRIIRVYANSRRYDEKFDWEEVEVCKPSKGSIFINGDLALRMIHFLRIYDGGGIDFAKYISDPDCHGAAMFTMGLVDYIKRISPRSDFKEIYSNFPAEFTYQSQTPPVMTHLLNKKIIPGKTDVFVEENTPHSIVYLGRLNGEEICFEKKGKNAAGFVSLKSTENEYKTRHRLFVSPAR